MNLLRSNSTIHMLSLVIATFTLTLSVGIATGQCGPGMTDACMWGAGNPCPTSSSCLAYVFNENCNSYTESPGLATHYKNTSLTNGNWYRCTTADGSEGACSEAYVRCATGDKYKDSSCLIKCRYTSSDYACQANGASKVCGYVGP